MSKTPEEQSVYFAGWYKKNRARKQKNARDHYDRRSAMIDAIKESKPCADCGQYYEACQMDFDHLGGKWKNVSRLRTYSVEKILKEIEKCDLVCASCHRLRTRTRAHSSIG